ncbi:MAG TPA: metallophosphoesterase family protein [Candidatus Koribacter sp.]|jgi:predicted phosphodiesterase
MRYLIISDIHSNLEALQTALAAAPEHDVVLNLGDIVGYGASPNEVVEIVRELEGPIVRGNHDKACSGLTDTFGFNAVADKAVSWTMETLTPENREWVRRLPMGPMEIPGYQDGQFAHGSPIDEDEYLLSSAAAFEVFRAQNLPVTFFGHTHVQGGYMLRKGYVEAIRPKYRSMTEEETFDLPLLPDGRYLLNPGSIGQPRDGDWRLGFALFDSDANAMKFYRVPYPVELAQHRIIAAELPEYLAVRLRMGR